MNLNVTRVDTKIGLACSMLYYIYISHRTGLSLQLLNVPVLREEPFARVFVCLFLTFVRMKSSLGYFLVVLVYSHSFLPCLGAHADCCAVWAFRRL